jgi:hypothetical protein
MLSLEWPAISSLRRLTLAMSTRTGPLDLDSEIGRAAGEIRGRALATSALVGVQP